MVVLTVGMLSFLQLMQSFRPVLCCWSLLATLLYMGCHLASTVHQKSYSCVPLKQSVMWRLGILHSLGQLHANLCMQSTTQALPF